MNRSLSTPFVRRPAMTILLTVSAIVFGVLAYRQLPVNDLPVVDYPVIQVMANYPGASPETMANNIATPLEKQFMQISGLQLVTSQSRQGVTTMTLQFDLSKSIDGAATDVQTAISQATGSLPVDLPSPPTFSKTNPNDQAILYIALTSDSVTAASLYDYANTNVGQQIAILPGVSKVNVFGTKAAIRVKADPSLLAARELSIDDVGNAIRANSVYSGVGQLDGAKRTFILDPNTQLASARQYENLIVGSRNGTPIYLRDVAVAKDTVQDERIDMRFWVRGHPVPAATVVLAVYRQAGANAVEVAARVKGLVPEIQAELPASINIIPIHDRSETIVHSVEDVETTLCIAFILVVLVIFAFLGRASDTLIPVVALPLSLLLTLICMNALGYSLDNLSLMALTLAIGFLVDDAIVFLENTVRRMEHGETAMVATLHSAREISFTILSMTLSLAAVFLPLMFMPGLIGRIFHEFAVTIIVSILASGVVSLTVTPLMCSRMLRGRGAGARKAVVERIAGAIEKKAVGIYGRSLWFFLRHRWISLGIWAACMAGTLFFFQAVPKSFLPIGDSGFIWSLFVSQEGTSYKQMRSYQSVVEKTVQADPAVTTTFTMTGNTGFFPASWGMMLIFLDDADKRPQIQQVLRGLQGKANQTPGYVFFGRAMPVLQISVGAASQAQGQYQYSLSGDNPQEVYDAAERLMGKMRAYPGFMPPGPQSDYMHSTPQLEIDVLRDQAATYGVSAGRIVSLLRGAYSQNYVYLIKEPTDQYQVILEAEDQDRVKPEDLQLLYVRSDDNQRLIPLSAVATWKEDLGLQAVNHINQFTSVTISFNLAPGANIGEATAFIDQAAKEVVPASVKSSLQGEAQTFRETIPAMVLLMLFAVFVMYVILGILYESFLHPITVLSTLPVALVGGLATLYVFHMEASLYAFIGMIMLMGIVKKNGIMIVDFAIQRVAEGQKDDQAIHDASMDRFRPILMTTAAAVMGAIPIAIGVGADPESRRPLGMVIVGGLVVSQFITLYITPVIYLYLEDVQEHVLDRIPLLRSARTHKEVLEEADVAEAGEVMVTPSEHGR